MQCPRAMRRTRRVCDSAGSAARAVWRRQSPSTTARQKKRRGRRRAPQPLRSCVSARHICSPTASTMLAHALSERSVSRGRSGSEASKHRLSGFSERWPPAVPRPTPTSPSDSWETRWPRARSWACVHMRRGATWASERSMPGPAGPSDRKGTSRPPWRCSARWRCRTGSRRQRPSCELLPKTGGG